MIPRICQVHGVTATQFIHNESGDGKTILDGHFGIQTHMIHDYVNEKHDVTTPRDVYEALTYQPLRNTLVNLISFDNNRIQELSNAAKLCIVEGSSVVRQVNYRQDAIEVYRHSDVGVPAIIPMWYIDGVFQKSGTLFSKITENVTTVTGVRWQGHEKPPLPLASKSLNDHGNKSKKQSAHEIDNRLSEAYSRAFPRFFDRSFIRCNHCFKYFSYWKAFDCHKCKPPRASQKITAVAGRIAVEAAGYSERRPLVQFDCHGNDVVQKLPKGWARRSGRVVENLGDEIKKFLTDLFLRGESSKRSKKYSPKSAQTLLEEAINSDGSPRFKDAEIPSEKKIKRFFSKLSSDNKKKKISTNSQ